MWRPGRGENSQRLFLFAVINVRVGNELVFSFTIDLVSLALSRLFFMTDDSIFY